MKTPARPRARRRLPFRKVGAELGVPWRVLFLVAGVVGLGVMTAGVVAWARWVWRHPRACRVWRGVAGVAVLGVALPAGLGGYGVVMGRRALRLETATVVGRGLAEAMRCLASGGLLFLVLAALLGVATAGVSLRPARR
ncbi:MAG: hypothetical protein CMN29_22360 [Sandaracinus sp.]|nr:hypothetical protein [Sandaracinus sp.]